MLFASPCPSITGGVTRGVPPPAMGEPEGASACYTVVMFMGGLTQYANRSIAPSQRAAVFVESEPRLTWTSLLADVHPEAEVYLVGGTVRDVLLGHTPNDIDLVVRNLDAKTLERFLSQQGAVRFVGERFGTFKFTPHGCRSRQPIDIALPRTEAIGQRHSSGRRDLKITSDHLTSIGEDLSRRDFTINAIAYNLQSREIIDPFFGIQDLDRNIIRCVLNPHERFFEDATRMLRALRFASQLGFAIEGETWEAIEMNLSLLNNTVMTDDGTHIYAISRDLIGKEFLLGFLAHPTHTLDLWLKSGALKQHLPNVYTLSETVEADGQTALEKTKRVLHTLHGRDFLATHNMERPSARALVAALGLFLEDAQTQLYKVCKKMRFHQFAQSSAAHVDCGDLAWMLYHAHDLEEVDPAAMRPSAFERLFCTERGQDLLLLMHARYLVDGQHSIGRERLHQAMRISNNICSGGRPEPLIGGRDLKDLGLDPGPLFRELLDHVRDAQLTGRAYNKEDALVCVRAHLER